MELFSAPFFSALLAIIVIDLVLAGDNAIVIGLAARSLPPDLQRKAILWGSVGAVVVRALLTLVVVWLLKIPGFLLVGALALLWIGWQLVAAEKEHDGIHAVPAAGLRQALQTIIIADTVMGVDNVLAVAGAAHGSMLLVVIGLLVSIPIVMLGSTLILKWVERFPIIVVIGAGVLGWTSAKMITAEPLFANFFATNTGFKTALYVFCVGIIVITPLLRRFAARVSLRWLSLAFVICWLTIFDVIEARVAAGLPSDAEVPLSHELIDLVMWLGWIPFVMMFSQALQKPLSRA